MDNFFYVQNSYTYDNDAAYNLALDVTTSQYEFDASDGKQYVPFLVRINLGNFKDWYDDQLHTTEKYKFAQENSRHYWKWLQNEIIDFQLDIDNVDLSLDINNKKGCSPVVTSVPLSFHVSAVGNYFNFSKWYKLKIDANCWYENKPNLVRYQITLDDSVVHRQHEVSKRSYGDITFSKHLFSDVSADGFAMPGMERYVNYNPKSGGFNEQQSLFKAQFIMHQTEAWDNRLTKLFRYDLVFEIAQWMKDEYNDIDYLPNVNFLELQLPALFDGVKTKSTILSSLGEYSFKNIEGVLRFDSVKHEIEDLITTGSSFDPVNQKTILNDGRPGLAFNWYLGDEDLLIDTTVSGMPNIGYELNYRNYENYFDPHQIKIDTPSTRSIDDTVKHATNCFCFVNAIFISYFNTDLDLASYAKFCKDFRVYV